MARRYKPLPAGSIVWLRIWARAAEVITDDGAGLVYVLERMRRYDYRTHVARSMVRPATLAEVEAYRLEVASIESWRRYQAELAQVQAVMAELAAAASVTPAPADPAG